MPTVTPHNDYATGRVARLVPVRNGHRAERFFRVSNVIDGAWNTAAGLPERGDQYVDDLGVAYDCFAATIEPVVQGGGGNVADPGYDPDNNGFVIVRVQYLPPSGGNGNIGLVTSWTQFSAGVSAERIFFPRDSDGLPDVGASRQLAGGQGAVVQNGEVTATLYRYFPGGVPGAFLNQMLSLVKPCHVNNAAVSFPRIGGQGSSQTQVLGPGQVLFRGFGEARVVNTNVYELPLYFGLAPDWQYYEAEENADGTPSGTLLAETVHPLGSFTALIA